MNQYELLNAPLAEITAGHEVFSCSFNSVLFAITIDLEFILTMRLTMLYCRRKEFPSPIQTFFFVRRGHFTSISATSSQISLFGIFFTQR